MQPISLMIGLAGISLLAACTNPTASGDINDPYETRNRRIHEANKAADKSFVKPVANAYGAAVPKPVRQGVENFADNLGTPGDIVNNVLQVRLGEAAYNFGRFFFNTTVGIGGLFDPATAIGLPEHETDFGETLHVWGFPEGAYVELPVLGPSTERDTVGKVVDIFLDPMGQVLTYPEAEIAAVAKVGARLGDRHDYSETIDSILYDSADSYAQARLLYLQNRRYELNDGAAEPEYFDPYEDPYAE